MKILSLINILAISVLAATNPTLSRYEVSVPPDLPHDRMDVIAKRFEVIRKTAAGFEVLVPVDKAPEFLEIAPAARLLERDTSAKWNKRGALDGFHNFDSVQAELKLLNKAHPDMTSLETYGQSQEGRPLMLIRLHPPFQTLVEKPKIFISSATHGDELITVEVVLGILNSLIDAYGKDARLTKIVDEHEIFFAPVINPDGYVRHQRYANGIDPNRNYPWPQDPNKKSNACIQGVRDLFSKYQFKASIDYHSAAAMIMYPWAYTYSSVTGEDEIKFDRLTRYMAQANDYEYGQISKIIYVAEGSSADFYYWKHGTFALGIEISQEGPASQIPNLVRENLESTYRFLENF